MAKKKNNQWDAAARFIDTVAISIASYYLLTTYLESTSTIQLWLVGLTGAWFVWHIAIFAWIYVVVPVANAILQDS